jgi:hypothetical protein
MKLSLLAAALFATALAATAHDHIEVGKSPANPAQLYLDGPAFQLALFVPRGEPFSAYSPDFPGGCFATELTFTTEVNALEFADDSLARVEVVAVTGPSGGHFSFWEVGTTIPTWTRPAGWTANNDAPSIVVYEDQTGYGHIHGRAFSMDRPGTYQVSFRALDDAGQRTASPIMTVNFTAQEPPALTLVVAGPNATISFHSRLNLSYDLQSCGDLALGEWQTIASWIDGAATQHLLTDPIANRQRAFYRLVEYR